MVSPVPKGDHKNVKGSLIKGTGANTVTNSKATSVIANGVREKCIREKGVTASKAGKKKRDTPIKE